MDRAAGETLGKVERSVAWWIGDWWAFGEARYGERKAIVEAEEWDGLSFQTAMNAAALCRKFETSRRRDVLSFNHHAEVAALQPPEADVLLDWCEETIKTTGKPRSTRELRGEVSRRRVTVGWLLDIFTSHANCGSCTLRRNVLGASPSL